MNEVIISGIIKGDFEEVSNDGVRFLTLNKGRNGENEEFICLAYGNSANFLRQHASSGRRVVVQGRLSSEKLDTNNYHIAVTVSRVLSVTDSSQGMDYSHAVISGTANSEGLTRLNNKNNTALISLNVANKREYRNSSGETSEYTTYLGGTLWGSLAESLEESQEFPMQDVPVVFEGILKPRSYEKDGETINKIDVWINAIQIGEGRVVSSSPAPAQRKAEAKPASTQRKARPLEGSPF